MRRVILTLLSASLLSTATSGAEPQDINSGATITLGQLSDAGWQTVPEYRAQLMMAPPVHTSVSLRYDPGTGPLQVWISAARSEDHYHLRLRWQDASEDRSNNREAFPDGVAVQFALQGGAATSYMMGTPEAPVNIWYWKAGAGAENLAAGGFGSTTRLSPAGLRAEANYDVELAQWTVIFSRPLQAEGEFQVALPERTSIALAVWQGAEQQRDGLKQVSPGWIHIE